MRSEGRNPAALDHAGVRPDPAESRFWAEAVSSAGALGLMQVMPATGKWIAGQFESQRISPEPPGRRGGEHRFWRLLLRTVLDQMGGSGADGCGVLQRAGPGRARAWRADVPLEGAIYAESSRSMKPATM